MKRLMYVGISKDKRGPWKTKKDQIKRDLDMKSMFHLQKDIIQLKTSSLSASPIQNQAGSPDHRVRTEVKVFPAGNNATSSSHIAFLKSLCNHGNYTSSVDIISLVVSCKIYLECFNIQVYPFQPRPSDIPKHYPSWISWKSREVYLPP